MVLSEAINMLIDLYKVNMYFEKGDKLRKTELELNQIKYNIIDLVRAKTGSVMQTISGSIAR